MSGHCGRLPVKSVFLITFATTGKSNCPAGMRRPKQRAVINKQSKSRPKVNFKMQNAECRMQNCGSLRSDYIRFKLTA